MNKIYNLVGMAGGVLVIIAVCMQLLRLEWSSYLFLLGAVMFAYVQIVHSGYDGSNFIIKRLRRQQILGAVLLIATGFLMIFMKHNEWVLCLTISAVIELYTSFRIPSELNKKK